MHANTGAWGTSGVWLQVLLLLLHLTQSYLFSLTGITKIIVQVGTGIQSMMHEKTTAAALDHLVNGV